MLLCCQRRHGNFFALKYILQRVTYILKSMSVVLRIFILLVVLITSTAHAGSEQNKNPLAEGKSLPKITLSEGKKQLNLPGYFAGKPFVLYFGNLVNDKDGFEFLSWGGAFTISLRQTDEILHDVYFAGVASLKNRPVYWVPVLVRKTIRDEMKKNDIRGEMFFDFKGAIADKLNIDQSEVRAVVVDKKGDIVKSYDKSVYDLSSHFTCGGKEK
jgi:hypothetical protein